MLGEFSENTDREHVDMGTKLLQEPDKENTNDSADVPFLIDFLYSFFFQKSWCFLRRRWRMAIRLV